MLILIAGPYRSGTNDDPHSNGKEFKKTGRGYASLISGGAHSHDWRMG